MNISYPPIKQGELYAGYTTDKSLSPNVSSGGIVSSILIELLERGEIDGAVVSRITSDNGKTVALTSIVRTRAEILLNAGSSYIDTPVIEKIKELKETDGRFAVVALPCQIRALQSMIQRDAVLREKLFPIIGLFCRGNVNAEFYDDYFSHLKIDQGKIDQIKISRQYLDGSIQITFIDGSIRTIPFMEMNAYRIAGIHAKSLCAWCDEHTSIKADISVGDIFTREYRIKETKHSAFISRNQEITDLLNEMQSTGKIKSEFVGLENYQKYFQRTERFSNNLKPRYWAAKIAGVKRPKNQLYKKTNIFHVLAWVIYFWFGKLSQTQSGRKFLFSVPSQFITLAAYIYKGLSRL